MLEDTSKNPHETLLLRTASRSPDGTKYDSFGVPIVNVCLQLQAQAPQSCVEKVVFRGALNRAFSLVEVIIAAAIISVVGLAMLSISSNQLYLFEQTKDRREANFLISIAAFNANKEMHQKSLDLSEYLKKYMIDDDDALTYFKGMRPLYTYEEVSEIELNEETKKDEEAYKRALEHESENNYVVLVDKISMQFDKIGSAIYRITLEE